MGTPASLGMEEPGRPGQRGMAESQGHTARRKDKRTAFQELRKGHCSPVSCRMPTPPPPPQRHQIHYTDSQMQEVKPEPDGYHFHATKTNALARDQHCLPRQLSLGRKEGYHPYQRFSGHLSEPSKRAGIALITDLCALPRGRSTLALCISS